MTASVEASFGEISQPPVKENSPFKRKKHTIARRMLQFFRRHLRKTVEPEQIIDPNKVTIPERPQGLTHDEKAREKRGCGIRGILSALGGALGVKGLNATDDEWNSRLKQFDKPLPKGMDGIEELYKLYTEDFPKNQTVLGEALRKVSIAKKEDQTGKQIEELIKKREQVLVFTDENDEDNSHVFHVGLDSKNRFIVLSDEKIPKPIGKGRRYNRVDLSHGTYTIFVVKPRLATVTKLPYQQGDTQQQEQPEAA